MLSEDEKQVIISLYSYDVKFGNEYCNNQNRNITFLKIDGKWTSKQTAKLRLEAQLCRKLTKNETVDHIDSNIKNDDITNLQLLSRSENILKAIGSGIYQKNRDMFVDYLKSDRNKQKGIGVNNVNSVFTVDDVIYYRKCFDSNVLSKKQIMDMCNKSYKTVGNMLNRITYKNIV